MAILARCPFFVKIPLLDAAPASSVLAIHGSSVGHASVLSPADKSLFEPEDDRGDDDHRAIIERPLLVARGQPTPLFEPIDAALDDIATRVDRGIEEERSPWPSRSSRALVASLGNSVGMCRRRSN